MFRDSEEKIVRSEVIDGKKFDIFLADNGDFCCRVDAVLFKAASLNGLKERLRAHLRVNRVKVKATFLDEDRWSRGKEVFTLEDITITGIHGSNQNILYQDSAGAKHQNYRHSSSILRVMTAAEKKKLTDAYEVKVKAEKIYNEMRDGLKLDVDAALVKAQEEVLDKDEKKEKEEKAK